ncbi:hypothetical protein J6590_100952 [Homalodisca vitripennis]|nr:hypothetical protein J6590_100952 [Homalodisca vitripennis]
MVLRRQLTTIACQFHSDYLQKRCIAPVAPISYDGSVVIPPPSAATFTSNT